MGQAAVGGIRGKLSMDGIDLGTKSMTNIMQSKEAWAKGILEADRAPIKNAALLNSTNNQNVRNRRGNGNLYGALSLGLSLAARGWESRDPTAQKALKESLAKQKNLEGRTFEITKWTVNSVACLAS